MSRIMMALFAVFLCLAGAAFAGAADEVYRVPVDPDGIQRVEIVGGSYFFKPKHIVVKVNVPVELRVRKEGVIVPHDIVIDAPEAGMQVRLDLKTTTDFVRFTPTKVGRYPMYCDKKLLFFSSHREKGMEGIVEVVE